MIENVQEAILLGAYLFVLFTLCIGVVLGTMFLYFTAMERLKRRRTEWSILRARDLHQDDLAMERAWQEYKRVSGLEHATRGDKMAFMDRMRAS